MIPLDAGSPKPKRKVIFADTETSDGLEGSKFAIGCWVPFKTSKVYTFSDEEEFCASLLKPGNVVYFHNLNFDGRFIAQFCVFNGIRISITKRGSKLLKLVAHLPSGEAVFQDSLCMIPVALEKFPKIFGLNLEKKGLDDLGERCRTDCLILREGLKKFWEYYPPSKRALTLPQAAFRELKYSIPQSVFFTSDGKEVNIKLEENARSGYFGGRVEAFSLAYYDKVRHYDVNSLYPYVMKKYPYPLCISKEKSFKKARKDGLLYLAECTVDLPYEYIPPLPVKRERLYFTFGKVHGWFYSPELEKVIEKFGESCVEVERFYAFERDWYLSEFVDTHYEKRLQHKKDGNGLEKIEKLIMNSVYGKFAQRREFSDYEFLDEPEEGSEMVFEGEGESLFLRESSRENTSVYINPVISGFVTSWARVELYNYLEKLQESALYCDTDSIVTDGKQLGTGDGLGDLKLEYEGPFKAYGCKLYWEGGKWKAKGFKAPKQMEFEDPKDFEKFLYGGSGMRMYMNAWEAAKRAGRFVAVKEFVRKVRTPYKKRKVLVNMATEPWSMEEIIEMEEQPKYERAVAAATKGAYESWKASDYYDPKLEDETLTEHERVQEFVERWRDYAGFER